jgi:16S rRNA (guanine966-N2)-methyltransferase
MTQGFIRIIGGEWRGRKLKVPDVLNLRPTPDRVRETLFNWLAPMIAGAYCLDAFAGSGALGFEALSRGAAHVVMADDSPKVIQLLQEEALIFKTENAEIYRAKAPMQLKTPQKPFDIVFLDPPFSENLLYPTCHFLEEQHLLAPNAVIYLESRETLDEKMLPANWQIVKSKRAGQVAYHLAQHRETC